MPVEVANAPPMSALSVGRAHACGLEAATGAAWCWGGWDGGTVLGQGRAGASPGAVKVVQACCTQRPLTKRGMRGGGERWGKQRTEVVCVGSND